MPRTNDVAIMDIGSKKFTVLIGENNFKGIYSVKGFGECEYEGFASGEWLNPEGLEQAAATAIAAAEAEAGVKIKKLFVGVPSEFLAVICKPVSITFAKPVRITDIEVDSLFQKGNDFNDPNFILVNSSPIYFTLDDQPRRIIEPRGIFVSKLSAMISYVMCEAGFIKTFDALGEGLSVKEIEYLPSVWAEAMGNLEAEQRDKYAILIDVGYITSSVALVRGDGLLHLSSFSVGGGHIAADLCTILDIPFDVAVTVKDKVDLNLAFSKEDVYEVTDGEQVYRLDAKEVHKISAARLDDIAEYVNRAIEICKNDCPPHTAVYLSGGGITSLRGAKEYLSAALNKQIEILSPAMPRFDKPYYSSAVGMLCMASKLNNGGRGSFIKKLIAKIGG